MTTPQLYLEAVRRKFLNVLKISAQPKATRNRTLTSNETSAPRGLPKFRVNAINILLI
jgi:hypothetical protein